MRLLVYGINMAPEPIGVGKATGELAAFLAMRGHEVRAIAAPPHYPAWRRANGYRPFAWTTETVDGVRVRRVPVHVPRRPTGIRRIAHLVSYAASSLPVALAEARRFRPQVVLAVAPTMAAAAGALAAARLARAASWLHVQDLEIDAAIALGQLRGRIAHAALAGERRLLGRFDRVSTIAPAMVSRLAVKGVPQDRLRLLPNGVDLRAIRPLGRPSAYRSEWGIDPATPVALYAGNLGAKQGLEILPAIAHALAPAGIRVVVVGEGHGAAAIAEAAAQLPNLTLRPLQPAARLGELLNLADIHLLPQRADAADLVMPSKLPGMLASGRPVVAGALPGTALARAVDGAGVAVAPDDAVAWAAAVEPLARDPARRVALGAAARARAEAEWDRTTILARFEAELAALADSVAGRTPID